MARNDIIVSFTDNELRAMDKLIAESANIKDRQAWVDDKVKSPLKITVESRYEDKLYDDGENDRRKTFDEKVTELVTEGDL